MKKFLILTAPFGHGHNKAAENIRKSLLSIGHKAQIVDFFSFETRYLSEVAKAFYDKVVFEYPSVFGLACQLSKRSPAQELTEYANRLSRRLMLKLLKKYQPDAVIATHFTPLGAAAMVRRDGTIPVYGIITDYYAYPVWAVSGADLYFTATAEVASQLHSYGIESDRLISTGIPIGPEFTPQTVKNNDTLTITVMSGGIGTNLVDGAVRAINQVLNPVSVHVLIGHNDKLRATVEAVARSSHHMIDIVGFTDQVATYMKNSDILITKPGGLTTAEALAVGIPLIIYKPIPGPEEYNARFLTSQLAAITASTEEDITYHLTHLADDRSCLATMSACAAHLGRPQATKTIADQILTHLSTI